MFTSFSAEPDSVATSSIPTKKTLFGRYLGPQWDSRANLTYKVAVSEDCKPGTQTPATAEEQCAYQTIPDIFTQTYFGVRWLSKEHEEAAWIDAADRALKAACMEASHEIRTMTRAFPSQFKDIKVSATGQGGGTVVAVCDCAVQPPPRIRHFQAYWTAPDPTNDHTDRFSIFAECSRAGVDPQTKKRITDHYGGVIRSAYSHYHAGETSDVAAGCWSVSLPGTRDPHLYIFSPAKKISWRTMSNLKARAETLGPDHPPTIFIECTEIS